MCAVAEFIVDIIGTNKGEVWYGDLALFFWDSTHIEAPYRFDAFGDHTIMIEFIAIS